MREDKRLQKLIKKQKKKKRSRSSSPSNKKKSKHKKKHRKHSSDEEESDIGPAIPEGFYEGLQEKDERIRDEEEERRLLSANLLNSYRRPRR